jgi:hypothetical protein
MNYLIHNIHGYCVGRGVAGATEAKARGRCGRSGADALSVPPDELAPQSTDHGPLVPCCEMRAGAPSPFEAPSIERESDDPPAIGPGNPNSVPPKRTAKRRSNDPDIRHALVRELLTLGVPRKATPAQDWVNYPEACAAIIERIRGVIVEHRPAIDVMRQHDGPNTLHYADPPYLPGTRSDRTRRGRLRYHAYVHEMTVADHEELLNALLGLHGMVVLSGYPSELYDDALTGWMRVQRQAMADGAKPRVEVIWLNPAAADRLTPVQGDFLIDERFGIA